MFHSQVDQGDNADLDDPEVLPLRSEQGLIAAPPSPPGGCSASPVIERPIRSSVATPRPAVEEPRTLERVMVLDDDPQPAGEALGSVQLRCTLGCVGTVDPAGLTDLFRFQRVR